MFKALSLMCETNFILSVFTSFWTNVGILCNGWKYVWSSLDQSLYECSTDWLKCSDLLSQAGSKLHAMVSPRVTRLNLRSRIVKTQNTKWLDYFLGKLIIYTYHFIALYFVWIQHARYYIIFTSRYIAVIRLINYLQASDRLSPCRQSMNA